MLKKWKFRLMALGMVAAAGLGGAMMGGQEAAAQQCCSECDPNYEMCVASCTTSSCLTSCKSIYSRCNFYCDIMC